jgi:lipid-binding SYLF domain-containing protein
VVLVFLNGNAPAYIGRSNFNLGGQASIAAGPIGRDLSAGTDYRATAEILSYSRSRGLFAGLNLEGTKWEMDDGANEQVYGKQVHEEGVTATMLTTQATTPGKTVRPFVQALMKNVPG